MAGEDAASTAWQLSAVPPQAGEQARLDAVRRYNILDTPPDGAFDRIASLAATLFRVPIATVTIVDEDRVWFKATHGLTGVTQIGVDPGLCASVVSRDGVYLVPDALLTDPRTLNHPLVLGEFGLRFYAAAPIMTADGYRLGTVNVIDREPREITLEQASALENLAAIVMDQLELRLSALRAIELEQRERERLQREKDRVQQTVQRLENELRDNQAPPTGSAMTGCQLAGTQTCTAVVVATVVDLTGTTARGCIDHAAQALTSVQGCFLASPSAPTLAALMS